MNIHSVTDKREFLAADHCQIRELLGQGSNRYSLAQARVLPGKKTKPHALSSSELYFILKGKGIITINEESSPIKEGEYILIEPHQVQSIENDSDTDLIFLCIVDPAWSAEDETILEQK